MHADTLKRAREARKISQEALGEALAVSRAVVARIEGGGQPATPAQVAAAAKALGAPELLVEHCEACPVASALLPVTYPVLDHVATHPAVVAHKIAEECGEALAAAEALFGIFNRVGWQHDPDARARVVKHLGQVRDVEVGIQILYRALFLGSLLPLAILQDVQAQHLAKCVARGYCSRPEAAA